MRRTAPDQAECARLGTLRITSATEGAVIPRPYGCLRIGRNIIWPTDFREKTRTTRQDGGKGGTTFSDAMKIDHASGQVELPQPTILPGLSAAPSAPPSGKDAVSARKRACAPRIDAMRPSGRDFPLLPHFGVNRIANWSPSVRTSQRNGSGFTTTTARTSASAASHPPRN